LGGLNVKRRQYDNRFAAGVPETDWGNE